MPDNGVCVAIFGHALLPVITVSGIVVGFVLGGAVAVELAFGVPGLGTALVKAIVEGDIVVVQNLVLLYGVIFMVVNILVDLSYAPRRAPEPAEDRLPPPDPAARRHQLLRVLSVGVRELA